MPLPQELCFTRTDANKNEDGHSHCFWAKEEQSGLDFESFHPGNEHTQGLEVTCWSSELLMVPVIAVGTGDEQGKQLV